jgi:multisubunit Na+/H+ antiporter MnhB subunit
MLSAVMGAARTTGRSFGRAAHQLWLEVTGLVFLIMALSFGAAAVREYEKFHAHEAPSTRLAIAICCGLTFAWFGLSSFWKARRKGQRN